MAQPPAIDHVRDAPKLAQMPPDSLEDALQRLGVTGRLADGQTFHLHGDEVRHVAPVLSRPLTVGHTDAQGRSHIVPPIGAGQFFDLLPVFDGGPALHDAHASGPTVPMPFEARAFLQLLHDHRALHEGLLGILFACSRLLFAKLNAIASMPLRQRCAQLLLHIVQTTQATRPRPAQGVPQVQASQAEMAQMLGLQALWRIAA